MSAEKSSYKKVLKKIAHVQVKHPYITILLIAIITLVFWGGVSQVKTVAALENMMPTNVEEIATFNALRDANVGQDMVAVVVALDPNSAIQTNQDVLTWSNYQYVKGLSDKILAENDISAVYSLSTMLEMYNNGPLTEEAFNAMIRDEQMQPIIQSYVNYDRTNTIITATTDVSANDNRMKTLAQQVIDDVDGMGNPQGVKISLTGTPIIQQELGKLIARDRKVTQNISTLFVFIITMILFGTISSALVPIIVVMLSVTWLYGTMGYGGLPISTLAGGVAAMVIGIGIDYAIHLMNKYKYERKRGEEPPKAIELAVTDTGVALTGASIATMLAFIAFLFGSMPEMRRFGILMTLGVGYSFILSIGALPALLVIEEKIYFKLRKHLHFGVEGEYYLAKKTEICPTQYEKLDISNIDESTLAHLDKKFDIYKLNKKNKSTKKKASQMPKGKRRQ